MLGYESVQQLVSTVTDTAHQLWLDPDERARVLELLRRDGVVRGYECRWKRKDGTVLWVAFNSRVVLGADGQPVSTEGFVEDVTERKRAQEALKESERRFREMLENIHLVSAMLDQGGNITFCNDFLLRLTGWKRDEVMGQNWCALFVPPGHGNELFSTQVSTWTIPPHHENEILTKTGQRRMISWNNTILFDAARRPIGVATIGEDVSERIRLENEMRQAQKLESIGRLAGGVAHDFNNLLTVINGFSDFLLKRLKSSDPLRSYAEQIREAGERAASLTKQLLAFSRKQIIEPRVLDLNTTIEQSVPMLQRLIGEDVVLGTRLDRSLGQVMADPDQVHQVIMNLAVNARDAMPDGGRLDIETTNIDLNGESAAAIHDGASPGHYVLMTVTDTGHGMEETIRLQVFEPFFTTKEVGKGTGLGLSTAHGIVRQSGGWIDVSSEVGVGTSFRIYLPRIDACSVPEEITIAAAAGGSGETILVAEDQEAVRSLAASSLRQHGYHVIEASDGGEALTLADRYAGEIHLLLTDVVMPGIDGKELSQRLKAVRPNVKVVFTSGYTADVIAQRGVLERGVAFLHKPFTPEELSEKVRDVLADVRRKTV
jgi:PAS domain S-box-containing protein